ncbi:MAG: hypothetical protein GY729_11450 [Desulfobacteraceae bacterium]|nr:hypothetical protein [Desulfobacteraceae bacterium]
MKSIKLLLMAILTCFLLQGIATAATVMTDAQITDIATTAEAGGDVSALASEYMENITADFVALGLTGDELQDQISVAIQELTSGLADAVIPNLEATVSDIVSGAVKGIETGIKQAVDADPNLDTESLFSSVRTGAQNAVSAIIAANPDINMEVLQAALPSVVPEEPEAFEPAEEEAFEPAETPVAPPVTPPEPPAVEAPITQDSQAGSPV